MTILAPVRSLAARLGAAAIRALHEEVMLAPKPGLVSPLDNGAHHDMTLETFRQSMAALAPWFTHLAAAGADGLGFEHLRDLGIAAETAMLDATGGINTHRGAIFSLGLLTASAGHRLASGQIPDAPGVCGGVAVLWGSALQAAPRPQQSHGARALATHRGAMGARDHALAGFPLLQTVALPALHAARRDGADERAARVQALFALMARMDDTNLLHRGGAGGLRFVQHESRRFLDAGGVLAPGWRDAAAALHRACIARHLSPGGAADMLACTLFLDGLARP